MSLRLVAWCNLWNFGAALHGDAGSRIHLTESAGLTGRTLCGRQFPANKGCPACGSTCKICVKKAYASGKPHGFSRDLSWVPSQEE